MEKRNIYIIVAVVFVLVILGYAFGWFGGSAPPPTATTPAPATPPAATTPVPAPATPAPATPAPTAPAQ